ncbi:serine aminopeptidase domain-containing protein, partial [Peribacillus simplex]
DEVDIWIDKARTLEAPVFLLGHSMGGLIAIEWFKQQRNPRITALILSSPCLGLQIKVNKVLDFASKGLNVLAPSLRVDSGLSPDMAT